MRLLSLIYVRIFLPVSEEEQALSLHQEAEGRSRQVLSDRSSPDGI